MKVTPEQVLYVADLANLELSAEEQVAMTRDLNSILGYIEMLNELDTTSVAPMAQVAAGAAGASTMREDIVVPPLPHEAALANAPEKNADFFKVPKVIER